MVARLLVLSYAILDLASCQLRAGGAGWALLFDGIDDFATILADLPRPPLTLEFWAQPLSLHDGLNKELVRFNSRGVLLSRHSTVSSQVLLSLEYLGSEIWHSGFVVDRVKPAAAPGEMFHYALVIQGAEEGGFESFVYVNGEVAERYTIPLLAVDAFTLDEAQPFPWILGARLQEVGGEWVAGDRPFGGIIDELRWWSVNRSQKQIRETMNMMNLQEVPGFREQLQSWSFDDPSTSGGVSATFALGSGNRYRSPVYVPSPFQGLGSPVVLETVVGAGWQTLQICAASLQGSRHDAGQAFFSGSLTTGLLRADKEVNELEMVLNLSRNGTGFPLCGQLFFLPQSPGSEVFAFEVQAFANSSQWNANGTLHVSVKENHPPVAGAAMALKTDGKEGYALLAGSAIPDEFSMAFWVKPDTVTEDAYFISRHLVSGSNVLMLGFWNFNYYFSLRCYRSCNGGQVVVGRAFMPGGDDDGAEVLNTGETVAQVREGRIRAQHLAMAFRCLFRGNQTHGARAEVMLYRNGQLIFQSQDFGACPDLEQAYSDDSWPTDGRLAPLTPWQVGSEYDAGPWDEHLLGMGVQPSNFLRASFDDVRLYSVQLTQTEVRSVFASQSFHREDRATLFHYTFDTDDDLSCKYRQLLSDNAAGFTCLAINDRRDYIDYDFLQRFPYMNSPVGPARHEPSPFQSRGAAMHFPMQEMTCAEVPLRASDSDGDPLTFHIVPPSDSGGDHGRAASLLPGTSIPSVRFCDTVGIRRDVQVPFDVCDAPGLCASQFTGLGRVIFHIFKRGPEVDAFQYLPDATQLRLVFTEPTNMPPVTTAKLGQLLIFQGAPTLKVTDILDASWEEGGQGLRLLMRTDVSSNLSQTFALGNANISCTLKTEGFLRDRNETSFFSFGRGPQLREVRCPRGTTLAPGQINCGGCGPGFFLQQDLDGNSCKQCRPGYFAASATTEDCLPCPRGTWQSEAGSSSCHNCTHIIPGSTTLELATAEASACICPQQTALLQLETGALGCATCSRGLDCPGGGRDMPFQAKGFFAREAVVDFLDSNTVLVAPPRLVACSPGKCPDGLQLGSCPLLQQGLACDACQPNHKWDGQQCVECRVYNNLALVGLSFAGIAVTAALAKRISEKPIFNLASESVASVITILANMLQAMGAIADLPLQLEDVSLSAAVQILKWFSLSAEVMDVSCVFSGGASTSYVCALLVQPTMIAMVVASSGVRGLVTKVNWAMVFSNVGALVLLLFLSSARVALLPLQCVRNPDGSSSVLVYRSTICWESGSHIIMIISSFTSVLIFIVGPVASVAWAVRVYPQRLQRPGGVQFMLAWRFAFDRFSPECYAYSVVFLLRNLMVAAIPMILVNEPQAMVFLLSLVLVCGMATQVRFFPWRNYHANFVDAAGLISISLILLSSAMLLVPGTSSGLQVWLLLQLAIVPLAILFALVGQLMAVFQSRRYYHIFLSHHKAAAACLARWFKTSMQDHGPLQIFLDSDDLMNLDTLFDTVSQRTQNLVLLLTRDILLRPWCVGEIVCAMRANVQIVCVQCNDFEAKPRTSRSFQKLEQAWTESEKNLLANSGIPMAAIRQALDHLATLEVLELNRRGRESSQLQTVTAALDRCSLKLVRVVMRKAAARLTSRASFETPIVILASESPEAVTCAFLVRRRLMALMVTNVEVFMPGSDEDDLPEDDLLDQFNENFYRNLRCVVVLLTPGVLFQVFIARALATAFLNFESSKLVPILVDASLWAWLWT